MIKHLPKLVLGWVAGAALAGIAAAQDDYPSRPIRFVVASTPGGLVDVVTRLVGQKMSERLGQPVIVENNAGAGTLLGIRAVKNAPADGYTILATSNTITAVASTRLEPGFDLARDFVGVGPMARSPWVVLVGPGQPDKSLSDLVARAKASPQQLTYASGGVGTMPMLSAESFLQRAGLQMTHVPYRGNGAAMPDVISGRVSMIFESPGSSAGKIRAGQVRALAVTSDRRLPAFPEIPTVGEQGYPNFTSYVYIALFAPAGTPREVVSKLSSAMQASVDSKDLRQRMDADGIEAMHVSPEQFNESLRREMVVMTRLVSDLGIPKN